MPWGEGYYTKTIWGFTRKQILRTFKENYGEDPDFNNVHVVRCFKNYAPGMRSYDPEGGAYYTVLYRLDDLDKDS